MNVTANQTTVLSATVISMMTESVRGSLAGNHRPGTVAKQMPEIANDASIALISDQALMRHQYQRRINTSPVPAPIASRNCHAPATVSSCIVTSTEARKRHTVAH